ncbi:hypothetical protein [Leptotrichia sp. oral taxon 221]|nr:hypothetical protein [Leptotrichia sp. oral taxon 221]QUB96979.1 hypothetical protein J4863_08080 [Leptotrichia sp. oral taxon 221]
MKLKELFPNQDIENMELKKLIETISYKDFNKKIARSLRLLQVGDELLFL